MALPNIVATKTRIETREIEEVTEIKTEIESGTETETETETGVEEIIDTDLPIESETEIDPTEIGNAMVEIVIPEMETMVWIWTRMMTKTKIETILMAMQRSNMATSTPNLTCLRP